MTGNADVIAPTNEQLATFVGEKYETYYQQKWATAGSVMGFNIAAFFLAGLWLAYRKMYWYAVIVTIISMIIKYTLMVPNLSKLITISLALILIGISISLGLLGNNIYKSFAEEKIKIIEDTCLLDETRHQMKMRGGTDLLGAFIYFVIVILISFIFDRY